MSKGGTEKKKEGRKKEHNRWQCCGQLLLMPYYLKIQCEILGLISDFWIINRWASSGNRESIIQSLALTQALPLAVDLHQQTAGFPGTTLKDGKNSSIQTFPPFSFLSLCSYFEQIVHEVLCLSLWTGFFFFFPPHMLPKQAWSTTPLTPCVVHLPWSEFAPRPASTRSHPASCFCLGVSSGLGEVSEVLQDISFPFLVTSVFYWSYWPGF